MSRSKAENFKKAHTLCWDCKWAVYSGKCPWSDHLEPVEGWGASKQKVSRGYLPYESYRVWRCPLFKRDAENGGQRKYRRKYDENSNSVKHSSSVPVSRVAESPRPRNVDNGRGSMAGKTGGRQRVLDQPNRDVLDLAFLILERAVEDWKFLERGLRAEVMVDKELVERKEVVDFFFSDWFVDLCTVTGYTPKQIRRYIKMPEDAREILAEMERRKDAVHY